MKTIKPKKQSKELENIPTSKNISKEEPFVIRIKKSDNLERVDIILNERSPRADAIVIFGEIPYKNIFGKNKAKGYILISISDEITNEKKYPLISTNLVFDLNEDTDTIIEELKKRISVTETENESENGQSNLSKSMEKTYVSEKEDLKFYKRADILKSNSSTKEKMLCLIETARDDIEEAKKRANLQKGKRK